MTLRIDALSLSSYGVFADRTFAFPAPAPGAPDLHILVGNNEAGKTTLKTAIVDALYGLSNRYAIGGGRLALTLGFSVDGASHTLERVGRKRAAGPAADALVDALDRAGLGRERFERRQAFSHDDMRAHGVALANSEGDLLELLLKSAAGLESAHALAETLAADANAAMGADQRSKRSRYQLAEVAAQAAEMSAREAIVDARAYADALAAEHRAAEAREAAAAEARTATASLSALDTLIALERSIGRIRAADERLAALQGPDLAPDAAARIEAALAGEAVALAEHDAAARRARALAEKREAVGRDPEILERAPALDALKARADALAAREEARAELVAQRTAALQAAQSAARAAGLIALSQRPDAAVLSALADQVPALPRRTEALRALTERGPLVQAVGTAREELRRVETLAEGAGDADRIATLEAAERQARGLGRVRASLAEHAARVRDAAAALARAERDAAADPDVDAPPPREEGVAADEIIAAARKRRDDEQARLAEADNRVAAARRAVRHGEAGLPVTTAALVDARASRDALWDAIVEAGDPAPHAAAFLTAQREADRLADARVLHATAIAAVDESKRSLARDESARDRQAQIADTARADYESAAHAWADRLWQAGFDTAPASYAAFFDRRAARLAAREAQGQADAAAHEARAAVVRAINACAAALDDCDCDGRGDGRGHGVGNGDRADARAEYASSADATLGAGEAPRAEPRPSGSAGPGEARTDAAAGPDRRQSAHGGPPRRQDAPSGPSLRQTARGEPAQPQPTADRSDIGPPAADRSDIGPPAADRSDIGQPAAGRQDTGQRPAPAPDRRKGAARRPDAGPGADPIGGGGRGGDDALAAQLEALLDRVGERLATARRAEAARAQAQSQRSDRARALADATAALAQWERRWTTLAEGCGLDPTISPDRAEAELGHKGDLATAMATVADCDARLTELDAASQALAADVAALAGELDEPFEDAAVTLSRLLGRRAAATLAEAQADQLAKDHAEETDTLARAEKALRDARLAITADRTAAGTDPADIDGLKVAAKRSDERRQVEADRRTWLDELTADGHEFATVAAALDRATPDERRTAKAAAAARSEAAEATLRRAEAAALRATDTRQRLEDEGRATTGAEAAHARTLAHNAMADAAVDALRLSLQGLVLHAARAAVAANERSPVLTAASRYFARFTDGSFDALEEGLDGERRIVLARRPGGELLTADALSAGTRDQLVAAVRLAAAADCPLPFLADDLFVNTDNARLKRGLAILADVARTRQVLFLTHRDDMPARAGDALGTALPIHSVDQPAL